MIEKIGIIGGAGMIGSWCCQKLVEMGHDVLIFDNFSSYPFDTIQSFDITTNIIKGDIRNKKEVEDFISGCDKIISLASLTDVGLTLKKPDENFEIDIVGTHNVLQACVKYKIKKLVFSSSASIYGSPGWIDGNAPMVSEKSIIYPTTNYANTKFFNETQLRLYYEHYGLPTTSLRYFSVYGERQTPKIGSHSWNCAIFTQQALKGKPITIFGKGEQIRDYTHVDDISEATVQCLFNENTNGKAFNVGTGIPTTVKKVAEMVLELTGSRSELIYTPMVKGDPFGCYADNSLMKSLLGWTPQIKIEDGLKRYVEWLKQNPNMIQEWV